MNYIGSKRRLAARIVPHIQEAIKTTGFSLYLEPFVGGANVIDKVDAPYRIGADNQRYLVALLSAAGGWNAYRKQSPARNTKRCEKTKNGTRNGTSDSSAFARPINLNFLEDMQTEYTPKPEQSETTRTSRSAA